MNVILIISDTVRYDYLGCCGSSWVRTPNLDALAQQAAVMDRYYSASFPTGPMRKDVHSGRFTFTYTNWGGERGADEVLLAETLKGHGVQTAFIGDTNNSPQFMSGFDHKQIIPAQAANVADVPEDVPLPADARKLRIPMKRIQGIVRNAMGWDGEADRRCARTMLAAHRWLEDRRGDDQPFFLWVDTFDPHEPWDPPRYYIDQYDPKYKGDELMEPAYEPSGYASQREIEHMRCMYAAKLTMVDRWIGHLLDGIERMGLLDDTAILFTSDHGFYHGEHGLIGKVQLDRDGTICGRWPLYATISHSPLMLRIPGLPGGQRFDAFAQPPDFMPTILDLMGCPAPARVQGQSLLPIVRGEKQSVRDFAVSSLNYVTDEEVRCPTCLRTKDWLYIYGGDEWASELYDLNADPTEERNVLDANTEQAKRLHAQLVDVLESVDCPAASLELRREFNPTPRPNIPHKKLI